MKIYIASSTRNREKVIQLQSQLVQVGFQITYDWAEKHWSEPCPHHMIRAVSEAEMVVLMLPGGRGAHFEFGLARALNKTIILYKPPEYKDCLFYNIMGIINVSEQGELFNEVVRAAISMKR